MKSKMPIYYNPESVGESYRYAYDEGWNDSQKENNWQGDVKFPISGHERETTFADELNYAYYRGYEDSLCGRL